MSALLSQRLLASCRRCAAPPHSSCSSRCLPFSPGALNVRSFAAVAQEHPVIDVSPLLPGATPRPGERVETLRSMASALREQGYFYAQNVHVLSGEYIASVYDYSRKLHSLPAEVKRRFAPEDSHGAYSGPDVGKAELQYEPGSTSTVRAWDYSRTRFTLASDDFDISRYPTGDIIQPAYVDFLDDLYGRQNVLARALMAAFADMLDLPSTTFLDMFDGGGEQGDFGTIRLLYYPGNQRMTAEEAEAAKSGISPHTDFEAFTLMHQDAPGLQFIPACRNGVAEAMWVDAPVRPGEFVVIVGDVLERLTNGELKATPHRVVRTQHSRSSIIRFNAVSKDTIIEPLPQFVSESRPAKYSRVTMGTHMETTMRNLDAGLGSWDAVAQRSLTANYLYIDGKDHRKVQQGL